MTKTKPAVSGALEIIADHWILLILRELFIGASNWSDFNAALNIAPSTLNNRIKRLAEASCLEKNASPGRARSSYKLTEAGRGLFPFMMATREWQMTWDKRPEAFVTPWVHSCGADVRCDSVCQVCHSAVSYGEVGLNNARKPLVFGTAGHHYRSSHVVAQDKRSGGGRLPKVMQVLGDQKASLLLAALLRGFEKFDEIQAWSGLHPGVLSERLHKLQLLGLCDTRLYQERPNRYRYFPSAAGKDFMGLTLQLFRWDHKWLSDQDIPRVDVTHLACGSSLEAVLVCRHCRESVSLTNTSLRPANNAPF